MSNGHQKAPTSVKDIVSAVFSAGSLDTPRFAPPQEQSITDLINGVFEPKRKFTPTIEPGISGFGKGLLSGIVGPFKVFGLDPDLEPRQPSGLPALPATPSRIVGEFTGAAAPIILSTAGAGAALGISGLEAAMGPALTRVVADAIGFGLFEAGHSEELDQVAGQFGRGAAIGAAFGIGHNILRGRLKGRSITGEEEFEISMSGPTKLLGKGPPRQIPSGARAQGPARPMGPVRGPETPKGAGGGPAVSPSGGAVIPVESRVVGETVNVSPKLYERLLEVAEVGPAKAALEAATVTSKGAQVVLSSGAKVQLRRSLEALLNKGAGTVARPAAKLRGELAEEVKRKGGELEPRGPNEHIDSWIARQEEWMEARLGPPVKATLGEPVPAGGVPVEADLVREGFEFSTISDGRTSTEGMYFPDTWGGRMMKFTHEGKLSRPLPARGSSGELPAGHNVLVWVDAPSGQHFVLDPKNVNGIPINVAPEMYLAGGITPLPKEEPFLFPEGVGDDGSVLFPIGKGTPGRGIIDVTTKLIRDANRNRIVPKNLPPGLNKLAENKYEGQVLLTAPEAKALRDELIGLGVKLDNTELNPNLGVTELNEISYAKNVAIPAVRNMLRRFDPTLGEIVDALRLPLVPVERRIPAQVVELTKGTSKLFSFRRYGGADRESVIYIHPEASSLENQFFNNRDLEEVFEAVGFALNPDDQLMIAAARAGAAFHKGGTTVLRGVQKKGVRPLIQAIKKVDPLLQVSVHPGEWGGSEVLISHPVVQGPRSLIRKTFREETLGIIDSTIADRGTEAGLAELLRVMRTPLEGEISPRVPIVEGFTTSGLSSQLFGGAYGTYTFGHPDFPRGGFPPPMPLIDPAAPQLPGAIMKLATEEEINQIFGTVVHEYTHHLFAAVANRAGLDESVVRGILEMGDSAAAEEGIANFFGLFEQVVTHWNPTPAQYEKVFGSKVPETTKPAPTSGGGITFQQVTGAGVVHPKMSEVLEAAVQVRARTGVDMFTPVKRNSLDWVDAFDSVKSGVRNYRTDTELAARLVELMVVDLEAAKTLAPTATKLMTEVIHEFSPRLTLALNNQTLVRLQDLVDEKTLVGRIRALHPVEEWSRKVAVLDKKRLQQFSREGIFEDMPIDLAGKSFLAEKRIPTEGEYTRDDVVYVKDPYTGDRFQTTWNRITRPGEAGMGTSTRQIEEFQLLLKDKLPTEVGLVVEDAQGEVAWRHAVSLERGDEGALLFEGYGEALDFLIAQNPELATVTVGPEQILQLLAKAMGKSRTLPGMVIRDRGSFKLVLPAPLKPPPQPKIIGRAPEFLPRNSFDRVNARVGQQVVDIDARTIAEGYLAGKTNARDLPNLVDEIAQQFEREALIGIEPEVFQLWNTARKNPLPPMTGAAKSALDKIKEVQKELGGFSKELGYKVDPVQLESGLYERTLSSEAARSGSRRGRTTDGRHRIDVDAADARRQAGVFDSTDDYLEYLRRREARRQQMGGLSEESRQAGDAFDALGNREKVGRGGTGGEPPPPGGDGVGGPKSAGNFGGGPGLGGGGGARPPRFGETMDGQSPPNQKWYQKLADAGQFFGAFITGMETTSKVIERNFGLPANTRIFEPLQKAIRKVDFEMKKPRVGGPLDGKSYHDQLKLLEKMLWQVRTKEGRANIVRWMEAMSKQEVAAPGGLMGRGMTANELKLSSMISNAGLQNEMPYLISTWRMMSNLMRGRKEFGRQYRQMIRQDLSPRVLENLETLRAASRSRKTWEFDEVAAQLGLTNAERDVIKLLEMTKKFPKDEFSIYAVSRHAAARDLPPGYNTMREAVADELGLSPLQLKIGAEMEKLFNATFPTIGIDPKRYLGGYYPHLRSYMAEGITPDAPYIKDIFPKASSFTSNKFRSGELDPYSMEPLKVAYKHVRGILMHQNFDPHMKDVRQVLQGLYAKDRRSFRLMNEYVRELQGKPHQSFTDLQKLIEGTAKIMGADVEKDFSRTIINSVAGLTYGATIPFRAALIARNYFQMVQMIAPRVGVQDFFAGLRIATTKEGYAMAKRAGAITENVAPIMSQEQMFNFTNLRLNQRLQRLTEVGFRWYQKADDLGRGAAFHAQRVRTGRAIDNLMKGKYGNPRTAQAKLKMLEDGKVLTFDPINQEQFIKLFDAGQYEPAKNYLGEMLARETIFRYGHANHPSGWGSVYGRLFGQFGTWPVQYKDFLVQGVTRGTAKDKIQFLATHGAINYGIIRGGMSLGYDLESWVSYPSLQYTGGPWSDIAIDMVKLLGGSEMERKMAFKSLQFQFVPTLSDPRAIWLPTSYAVNDALKLFSAPPALDEALGFRRIEHDIDTSAILGLN